MRQTALAALALLPLAAGCPSTTPPASEPAAPSSAAPAAAPEPPSLSPELQALMMDLYVEDDAVVIETAGALEALGAEAGPALPELIDCAANWTQIEAPLLDPRDGGEELPPPTGAARACARAVASVGAAAPDAMEAALKIPLAEKERLFAVLAGVGRDAAPVIAAAYLDSCAGAASAEVPDVASHLERSARAALEALATVPGGSAALEGGEGACAADGAEQLSMMARRR